MSILYVMQSVVSVYWIPFVDPAPCFGEVVLGSSGGWRAVLETEADICCVLLARFTNSQN